MKKLLAPAVLTIGLGVLPSSALAATTRVVDDDHAQCPNAQYTSIQAAVTASGPGDRVAVCPGTYNEQVVVPGGKNGLEVYSTKPWAAVIKAPPTIAADVVNSQSIVRITQSRNVTLRAFTVTGPGPGPCNTLRYGVRVDGDAWANILYNHITEVRDNPFSGCQNGVAIQVGRQFESQTGHARILGNLVDRYQKNGMTIDNAGSSALVAYNSVVGQGSTTVTAQNGIQISRGATAAVYENSVRDHAYIVKPTLAEFTATGILLYQPGRVQVEENSLRRNQDGVGLYTADGVATVEDNKIIGGIATPDPLVGTMNFGDGIYAGDDTANNRIKGNYIRDNREHDCHDDSTGTQRGGVANYWIHNDGLTENKPGLCIRQGDGHDGGHGDGHGDRRSSQMR
jgi:hypothetical protein